MQVMNRSLLLLLGMRLLIENGEYISFVRRRSGIVLSTPGNSTATVSEEFVTQGWGIVSLGVCKVLVNDLFGFVQCTIDLEQMEQHPNAKVLKIIPRIAQIAKDTTLMRWCTENATSDEEERERP